MKKLILPLLLIGNSCFAQVNLNFGLRAYYPFTGNANDVSGNGNNPVFNNATLTTDRFGNINSAYRFNGSTSYIRVPNSASLNTTNTLSLSAWVKPSGYYAGTCHGNSVMMKGDAGNTPGRYHIWYDDNAGTNGVNCSGGPVNTAVENFYGAGAFTPSPGYTPYIQTNQWYSVVITYDGTTAKLFVDCQLKYSGPQAGLNFTNADDLFIGKINSAAFPYWVNGDIDEVRIYDRALTVDEVNVLGGCPALNPCTTWLKTTANGDYATVGDLDVTGNQLTVEASYNRTAPLNSGLYPGHLVSKHTNAGDLNYALFPNGCSITTNVSGYKETFENCALELNKTYHVAMVYDGSTLKYYRNGFLHSQVACTGNLINNNLATTIAEVAGGGFPVNDQFLGNVNEVRIWNVARTQAQLQTYMNSSIPTPTTQTGLLGYYVFDNLLNKQGNAAYNVTLNGGATINTTNPNCTFIADTCPVIPPISNIINTYTPVLALNPCDNKLTVEDASTFNTGDTVLMIQMKGAVIDSTNTAAFGTITDYKNAGNYEFNYVKSKAGNIIELKNKLTRQYDIPFGKVQLVRVPYYNSSVAVTTTLTCLPWDGNKGGILVLNVRDTVNLNADIDVSGNGFRGGNDPATVPGAFNCNENQYYYPVNPDLASEKGEGIALIAAARSYGKGALANGGGSGISHNSGGGGGGNISVGGLGGYQFEGSPCNGTVPFDNRGIGGRSLTYSNANNKIFLGGGGGAGHSNNPEGLQAKGGNGAGIVMIIANKMINNARKIIANGNAAPACGLTNTGCHEGMGGGGAAGTVLLQINGYIDNMNVETQGGKGADMTSTGNLKVGPGGGGSGGVLWVQGATIPAAITVTNTGGPNGVCTGYANDPWGSTPGTAGSNLAGLIIPFDNILFTPNIDSVRIKDSLLNCNGFDFKGLAYTNTNPIASWFWDFGDGNYANTQNTSHAYLLAGTYTVKLLVTDINGCQDSIFKNVNALPGIVADAGIDTAFCSNGTVIHMLQGSGVGTYSWTPAIYLDDPNLQNPTATINATTVFYLTVTSASACVATDSVILTVNPVPLVQTLTDTSICKNDVLLLTTTLGAATYSWTPAAAVSNPNIASPLFIDIVSSTLIVTGTNASGCFANDTIDIFVKPLPLVKTIDDTTICSVYPLTLVTNGALTYSWTPILFLSNPNIASPVYSGNLSQTYYVTGTAINGCKAKDTVNVTVNLPKVFLAPPNKSTCDNSFVVLDGNNGTNNVDYLWSPGTYLSSTTIINPIANPPVSALYNVLITDKICNTDSNFVVQVTIVPRPIINAGKSNDIDCANRTATLFASGGTFYNWTPSTGLNNNGIPNPIATITTTQTYVVEVTNAIGCTNKDSVTVFVNYAASLARYMPTAFTPNGDGKNDCYGLSKWLYVQQLQFIIYNRWGERVFSTNNPYMCWDGNYAGKKADPGTYVFYIKAQTACGTEEQTGNFILIR